MFYYGNHDIKVLSHSEARAVNEIIELARNLIYDGFLGDWDALHREVLKFIPSLTASRAFGVPLTMKTTPSWRSE